MKKIVFAAVAASLFAFASCSSSKNVNQEEKAVETAVEQAAEAVEETAEEAAEAVEEAAETAESGLGWEK